MQVIKKVKYFAKYRVDIFESTLYVEKSSKTTHEFITY